MVGNLTFSTSIFESLGILSSFNLTEKIWGKYEKFAIPKIKNLTIKIRGSVYYLKDLTPKQAVKELNSISFLMPVLSKLRENIEPIDGSEFYNFKTVTLDFFETVDFLYLNLQDVAEIHSSYDLSKSVLAIDWDSSKDEHWNNY